jgi:uncharacterized protein YdeI (YjbR/CyaY-like superfamily)
MKPTFFKTPKDFRAWLAKHHESEKELLVGFYKVESGKPSITWPQSVDEALSFGWIDGVRRRVDDEAYSIRFTPRTPESIWSAVNIKRMGELIAEGRVAPSGMRAFERRDEKRSELYSYERKTAAVDAATLARFQREKKAWQWFTTQAPWYQRVAAHWVTSAKRPETREKRLGTLIACSKKGERISATLPPKPTR